MIDWRWLNVVEIAVYDFDSLTTNNDDQNISNMYLINPFMILKGDDIL